TQPPLLAYHTAKGGSVCTPENSQPVKFLYNVSWTTTSPPKSGSVGVGTREDGPWSAAASILPGEAHGERGGRRHAGRHHGGGRALCRGGLHGARRRDGAGGGRRPRGVCGGGGRQPCAAEHRGAGPQGRALTRLCARAPRDTVARSSRGSGRGTTHRTRPHGSIDAHAPESHVRASPRDVPGPSAPPTPHAYPRAPPP